jgi:hypothetical protein
MAVENGIGYSPLSEKVYFGKQNKSKGMWVGDKKDITDDFVSVALNYFAENSIREITFPVSDSSLIIHVKNDRESIEKLIGNLTKRLNP